MGGSRPVLAVRRWITPIHGGIGSTSQTFTVGRVLLLQFDLGPTGQSILVDGLSYVVGAVSAGNVTGGIYGPVASIGADTPEAAPLIVESASTAQGAINTPQVLALASTQLRPGIYYAALEGSDVTGTYMRQGNQSQAPGTLGYFDRGGGYGALTNPCPAITVSASGMPALRIRVSG